MGWLGVALVTTSLLQAQQKASPVPSADADTRMLVVTYSDGRTSEQLLRPGGLFWTPLFPRRADAPGRDGLKLAALQVEFRAAADVRVRVSLKYGTPHQKTVPVAEAVIGSEPVRIADLEAYGVDPITVSVEAFSPASLVQPVASSASPLLDVSVDLLENDVPLYKFTLRNRSNRAVMAVQFLTFKDGKQIGSGRRKTNRHTPIVEAAGEYTWTAPVGAGPARGFDRFEVSAVLWDDGSVEGDGKVKASEDALAVGMARQLRRVLALLSDALPLDGEKPWSAAQLRGAVERLPIHIDTSDPLQVAGAASGEMRTVMQGQQMLKDAVLEELSEFGSTEQTSDPASTMAWIAAARTRYSAWLRRIGVN
jgi:hypothetical protein